MRWLWNKIVSVWKWIWRQLKDWHNLVIFVIVFLVVSCEVWVPYLTGAITGDGYWFAIGSACWAFWLAPFTPFLPLCIAITLGIRKLWDKIKERRHGKQR